MDGYIGLSSQGNQHASTWDQFVCTYVAIHFLSSVCYIHILEDSCQPTGPHLVDGLFPPSGEGPARSQLDKPQSLSDEPLGLAGPAQLHQLQPEVVALFVQHEERVQVYTR